MFKILDFSRGDIERQLTLCLMGTMVLFLAPFSIYRLLNGDTVQFIVDLLMSAIAGFAFIQTWRRKKSKGLNYFSVISFMTIITVLISLKGIDLFFWAFPGIIGTYFLLASTPAVISNIVFIMMNTVLFYDQLTKTDITNIYPSLLLVCIFGYVLSKRAEYQNKKLFNLVSIDTLTGVKNRRSFDEKIEEVLLIRNRSQTPVCLLLLDLDFFKQVNDTHGHKQGDAVLLDFAQRVKLMIRNTDFLYRIGGEEFAIISTNSELKNTIVFADTIRETIQHTPSLSKYKITVSIGISEIEQTDNIDSWFSRADRALYEAKSNGRNSVYSAQENDKGAVSFNKIKCKKNVIASTSKTINRQQDKSSVQKENIPLSIPKYSNRKNRRVKRETQ